MLCGCYTQGATTDAKSKAIVAKYIEALGGLEAHEKLSTRRVELTMSLIEGMEPAKVTILQKAPDKRQLEFSHAIFSGREVSNGEKAWLWMGENLQMFDGRELPQKLRDARFHGVVEMLTTGSISYVKEASIDKKSHHQLTGSYDDDSPWAGLNVDFFIDTDTHLLRRMKTVEGGVTAVIDIAEYLSVDGIKLASKATIAVGGGKMALNIDTVRHGVEVDDALFVAPTNDAEPAADILDQFVGNWDVQTRSKRPGQAASTTHSVTVTGKTKSGHAIRSIDSSGRVSILGFSKQGNFPGITMSGIESTRLIGTWDAANKTMTLTEEHPNWRAETRVEVVDNGRLEIKSVTRDRGGKELETRTQSFDRRPTAGDWAEPKADAVLDRYNGSWKSAGQEAETFEKTSYRTRLPGSSILHMDDPKASENDGEFQMLMTYDPASKTYPAIMVTPDDTNRFRVSGTWNEAEQTMTFRKTFPDGNRLLSVTTFDGANSFSDHSTVKGAGGKLFWEQTVSFTRKSEGE